MRQTDQKRTASARDLAILGYFSERLLAMARLLGKELSPHHVHRLRVAARQVQAVLRLLKTDSPELRRFGRKTDRLVHALGKVRELDVAIKGSRRFDLDPAALQAPRRRAKKKVRSLLRPKKRADFLALALSSLRTLERRRPYAIAPAFARMRAELARWQSHPLRHRTEFHKLRIAVKKIHYALSATGKPVRSLASLQSLLGQAHDLEILRELQGKTKRLRREERRAFRRAEKSRARALAAVTFSLR